jgi:hypothetical protein
MELETSQPMEDVNVVVGKELSLRMVESVQDVEQALRRTVQNPSLVRLLVRLMETESAVIWLWGEQGICIAEVMENELDGRFLFLIWLQNEVRESDLENEVLPTIEDWAKLNGCKRIAGAVERASFLKLLPQYKTWKLVVAKEL